MVAPASSATLTVRPVGVANPLSHLAAVSTAQLDELAHELGVFRGRQRRPRG
jgi:hypothetical protein